MKEWKKELLIVMSKSNIDNLQKDIMDFFNQKLTDLIKEVEDRDKILADNLKKRFVD